MITNSKDDTCKIDCAQEWKNLDKWHLKLRGKLYQGKVTFGVITR